MCPACGKSDFKENTLAELLYGRPDRLTCQGCWHVWQETGPEDSICPVCGSREIAETYPEIPHLEREDPGLALVLFVEGNIPRQEGVVLHREMVAWLRFHGVRQRSEILEWEWFFREIQVMRSRIVEEISEPTRPKGSAEDPED